MLIIRSFQIGLNLKLILYRENNRMANRQTTERNKALFKLKFGDIGRLTDPLIIFFFEKLSN